MKVGIVGASGYTGEVLVQLYLGHPQVKLVPATSQHTRLERPAQVVSSCGTLIGD
ncbi:MAG: hypothetical protein K9M98_14355 [Cephaloticoccus sp.]|nr:hypothetical protein [Cephaloticoccus sp.]MCF7761677.1 hypothetical protein [Cephaloticoccus sp.]